METTYHLVKKQNHMYTCLQTWSLTPLQYTQKIWMLSCETIVRILNMPIYTVLCASKQSCDELVIISRWCHRLLSLFYQYRTSHTVYTLHYKYITYCILIYSFIHWIWYHNLLHTCVVPLCQHNYAQNYMPHIIIITHRPTVVTVQ